MPKQVGNEMENVFLRQATFGSFSKLRYTHFCVRWSQNILVMQDFPSPAAPGATAPF